MIYSSESFVLLCTIICQYCSAIIDLNWILTSQTLVIMCLLITEPLVTLYLLYFYLSWVCMPKRDAVRQQRAEYPPSEGPRTHLPYNLAESDEEEEDSYDDDYDDSFDQEILDLLEDVDYDYDVEDLLQQVEEDDGYDDYNPNPEDIIFLNCDGSVENLAPRNSLNNIVGVHLLSDDDNSEGIQ